jgi:hypothetical protein
MRPTSARAPIFLALCAALASACGSRSPDQARDAGSVDGGAADLATSDAGASRPDAGTGDPGALCADRTGGALITLGNAPASLDGRDQIVLWITNSAFIDEAIQHQARGDWRVAFFDQVIAGTDCDPTHRWHVDPARATWADTATEVCDATITYVTAHVPNYGPSWCPYGGVVIAVDDRR